MLYLPTLTHYPCSLVLSVSRVIPKKIKTMLLPERAAATLLQKGIPISHTLPVRTGTRKQSSQTHMFCEGGPANAHEEEMLVKYVPCCS